MTDLLCDSQRFVYVIKTEIGIAVARLEWAGLSAKLNEPRSISRVRIFTKNLTYTYILEYYVQESKELAVNRIPKFSCGETYFYVVACVWFSLRNALLQACK